MYPVLTMYTMLHWIQGRGGGDGGGQDGNGTIYKQLIYSLMPDRKGEFMFMHSLNTIESLLGDQYRDK